MAETLTSHPESFPEIEKEEFNLENVHLTFNSLMQEVDRNLPEKHPLTELRKILPQKQLEMREKEDLSSSEKSALSLLIDTRRVALGEKVKVNLEQKKEIGKPVQNGGEIKKEIDLASAAWQGELSKFLLTNLDKPWVERFAEEYWDTLEHYQDQYELNPTFAPKLKNGVIGEVCFSRLAEKIGFRVRWPLPQQDVEDKIDLLMEWPSGPVLVTQIKTSDQITQPKAENLSGQRIIENPYNDQQRDRNKLISAAARLENEDLKKREYIPIWVDMSANKIVGGVNLLTGNPEEWYTLKALKGEFGQTLIQAVKGGKAR